MWFPAIFAMGFRIKFLLFSQILNCPSIPTLAEVSQDALFQLGLLADRASWSVQVHRAILEPSGYSPSSPKVYLPGLDSVRATGAKD